MTQLNPNTGEVAYRSSPILDTIGGFCFLGAVLTIYVTAAVVLSPVIIAKVILTGDAK